MSIAGIASAAAAANKAQVQMAMAAKFAKMNTAMTLSVVALIEAANENLQQVSNAATAPHVGTRLDVSA